MEVKKIVELLCQNESLFAEIYRECARLFPDFKDEFESFASEEQVHADMFARMLGDIGQSPEKWRLGKVSVRTIEIVNQQAKEALAEIRGGRTAPRYAITVMRSFEQGMGERSSEKLFETDNELFKSEVASVRNSFTGHLSRLQELERKIFPRSAKEEMFEI